MSNILAYYLRIWTLKSPYVVSSRIKTKLQNGAQRDSRKTTSTWWSSLHVCQFPYTESWVNLSSLSCTGTVLSSLTNRWISLTFEWCHLPKVFDRVMCVSICVLQCVVSYVLWNLYRYILICINTMDLTTGCQEKHLFSRQTHFMKTKLTYWHTICHVTVISWFCLP